MKWLVVAFLALALYSILVGKVLLSFLAVFMAGISWWALREFDKVDAEWANDPRNAHRPKLDTMEELESQDCESARSRF